MDRDNFMEVTEKGFRFKLNKNILPSIGVILIVYICCVIMQLDFNLVNWSEGARYFFCWFSVTGCGFIFMTNYLNQELDI